jgi:hypothetical protein
MMGEVDADAGHRRRRVIRETDTREAGCGATGEAR